MKRYLILIILVLMLTSGIVGCIETEYTPAQKPDSTGAETPINIPSSTQEPETGMKSTSKVEPVGAEAPAVKIPHGQPERIETSLAETTKPQSKSNPNITTKPVEPVLLDTLRRNCQITQGSDNFENVGLLIGDTAVNFTLKDIRGSEFRLSQLLAENPVMMVFGSFT